MDIGHNARMSDCCTNANLSYCNVNRVVSKYMNNIYTRCSNVSLLTLTFVLDLLFSVIFDFDLDL